MPTAMQYLKEVMQRQERGRGSNTAKVVEVRDGSNNMIKIEHYVPVGAAGDEQVQAAVAAALVGQYQFSSWTMSDIFWSALDRIGQLIPSVREWVQQHREQLHLKDVFDRAVQNSSNVVSSILVLGQSSVPYKWRLAMFRTMLDEGDLDELCRNYKQQMKGHLNADNFPAESGVLDGVLLNIKKIKHFVTKLYANICLVGLNATINGQDINNGEVAISDSTKIALFGVVAQSLVLGMALLVREHRAYVQVLGAVPQVNNLELVASGEQLVHAEPALNGAVERYAAALAKEQRGRCVVL
jgi:hypothetical protein